MVVVAQHESSRMALVVDMQELNIGASATNSMEAITKYVAFKCAVQPKDITWIEVDLDGYFDKYDAVSRSWSPLKHENHSRTQQAFLSIGPAANVLWKIAQEVIDAMHKTRY